MKYTCDNTLSLGFLCPKINRNENAFLLFDRLNKYNSVDAHVYTDTRQPFPIRPQFSIFNFMEMQSFRGNLIGCEPNAIPFFKMAIGARVFYYAFDFYLLEKSNPQICGSLITQRIPVILQNSQFRKKADRMGLNILGYSENYNMEDINGLISSKLDDTK